MRADASASLQACTTCGGDGRKAMDRCPSSLATDDVRAAFRAYARVRDYGAWPVAGGIDDQAASFVAFVDLVESEVAATRRDKAQAQENLRQLQDLNRPR